MGLTTVFASQQTAVVDNHSIKVTLLWAAVGGRRLIATNILEFAVPGGMSLGLWQCRGKGRSGAYRWMRVYGGGERRFVEG